VKIPAWISKVFGKYFNQPLDKTLKDLKAIHVISIVALYVWGDLLIRKAVSIKAEDASLELVGLYLVNFMAIVPMFMKSVHDIRRPYYDPKTVTTADSKDT